MGEEETAGDEEDPSSTDGLRPLAVGLHVGEEPLEHGSRLGPVSRSTVHR
jgi:hypothetical protein